MFYTNDPLADFDRWQRAQELRLELLPKCVCCKEPIQQDTAIYIDGDWFCEECELDAWDEVKKHYMAKVEYE